MVGASGRPYNRVFGVSILGIGIMVLGEYLLVGYLDPQGR